MMVYVNSAEAEHFFALLRLALGNPGAAVSDFLAHTREDWLCLQDIATRQSVLGLAYLGIGRLPVDKRPPSDILLQWAWETEQIRGHNSILNAEAARLTEAFAECGCQTAVLKGPANARLYPDPLLRQCGDIDIWVSGGKDEIIRHLDKLGWSYIKESNVLEASHHLNLSRNCSNAQVEIHFKLSSGNYNPFTNSCLMQYLESKIKNVNKAPEGFYVPSLQFALVMQLAHIQKHFINKGIGFRQLVDYFILLQHSTESDRKEVAAQLPKMGLSHTCGALMWVLEHVLGLEQNQMLCRPDHWRGAWMLDMILAEGHFGFYNQREKRNVVPRWFAQKWRSLRLFAFVPSESLWKEFYYWGWLFRSIPLRIRLRKFSLRDIRE